MKLFVFTDQIDDAVKQYAEAAQAGSVAAPKIVREEADNIINDVRAASERYGKSQITREGYYHIVLRDENRTKLLCTFGDRISAGSSGKISLLRMKMGLDILAQASAAWISYIETNQSDYMSQAKDFETSAIAQLESATK